MVIPEQAARRVESQLTAAKIPGVGIVVIRDFEIADALYLGQADVSSARPVTEKTLFQAASISKPFCATIVHLLAACGNLSLDDDVNKLMTSWSLPDAGFGKPVTVRDVLSHTGGLGDGLGYPGYSPGESLPSPEQIVAGTGPSNHGPVFRDQPAGGEMKYSGGGYQLLQLVVEDVTGRSLAALEKELVFDPLGMSHSSHLDPVNTDDASRAHDEGGTADEHQWMRYPETAAAGLWTTPIDLAKYVVELLNAHRGEGYSVISTDIAHAMATPVGENHYGLGLEIQSSAFGHGGGNWGFSCSMMGIPKNGSGMVVMTNCWGVPTYEFISKVTDIISYAMDT